MADNKPENYDGRESEEPQVWSMEPFRRNRKKTYKHNPCGHWHLPGVVSGCLQYISNLDVAPVSAFYPNTMILGSDDKIYVVFGGTAAIPAKAEIYDKTSFELIATQTYDLADDILTVLRVHEYSDDLWVLHTKTGGYEWLSRISMSDLSLTDQRVCADCSPGTDGHIYHTKGNPSLNTFYAPLYCPVTGVQWSYQYALLPDDYAFHVYDTYPHADQGGRGMGAAYINDFLIHGGYIYLSNNLYPMSLVKRNLNMERTGVLYYAAGTGQTEMCWNPGKTEIAVCNSNFAVTSYSSISVVRVSDMTEMLHVPLDDDGFHPHFDQYSCILWHSNNYIYNVQHRTLTGGEDDARVVKIDRSTGNIVAQFQSPGKDGLGMGRIVASNTNVYWFQSYYGDATYGGIVKLDLNLNLICIEPFHFVDPRVDPFWNEAAFGGNPLFIDTATHMIYSGLASDGHVVKWDYYA